MKRAKKLPPGLRTPPRPTRPWDPSLRQYLNACRAAYLNAVALKDDASLLLRNKRYPRAAALSVTGFEEAGKALVLWFLGIGHVKSSHRERVLEALRRKHMVKQATALVAREIGRLMPLTRHVALRIPSPRKRPRNWGDVETMLQEMLPEIVSAVQPLLEEVLTDESAIEEEVSQVTKGSLEARRLRALYTDLVGGIVQSPAAVRRQEAVELLRDLRASLRPMKWLAEAAALTDEGVNTVLASSEMHDRLWSGARPPARAEARTR